MSFNSLMALALACAALLRPAAAAAAPELTLDALRETQQACPIDVQIVEYPDYLPSKIKIITCDRSKSQPHKRMQCVEIKDKIVAFDKNDSLKPVAVEVSVGCVENEIFPVQATTIPPP